MPELANHPVDSECLETPKQLASRVGLTERQIRNLIHSRQLEHVMIGSRVLIPAGAFTRFIEAKKAMPCQDETRGLVSVGSTNVSASTLLPRALDGHGRPRAS